MDIRRAGPDCFSSSRSRSMERDSRVIQNQLEARYSPKELIRTSHLRSCRLEPAFHSKQTRRGILGGLEQMMNRQRKTLTFLAKCTLAVALLVFVATFTLIWLEWTM